MIKRNLLYLFLMYALITAPLNCLATIDQERPKNIYDAIGEQFLKSVTPPNDYNSGLFYSYTEFIRSTVKQDSHPQEYHLVSRTFARLAHRENEKLQHGIITNPNTILDKESWYDLELFCGNHDPSKKLFSKLDRTKTAVGKAVLAKMLVHPTATVTTLKKRQKILKELITNKELFEQLNELLTAYKDNEILGISVLDNSSPFETNKLKQNHGLLNRLSNLADSSVIFNQLNKLQDYFRNVSYVLVPAIAAYAYCAYFLSDYKPFAAITPTAVSEHVNNRFKEEHSTSNWVSLGINFLNQPGTVMANALNSRNSNQEMRGKVGKFIMLLSAVTPTLFIKSNVDYAWGLRLKDLHYQKKINALEACIRVGDALHDLVSKNELLQELSEAETLDSTFTQAPQKNSRWARLIGMAHTSASDLNVSLVGEAIVAHKMALDCNDIILALSEAVGEIDAYVSMALLYKEHEKSNLKYQFVEYVEAPTPSIEAIGFWNPFLSLQKAVPNTITIGTKGNQRNAIITGPNAGGKSTLLKALAMALILAQTFGMAPAERFIFTLVSKIVTYLNHTDDIASGQSLFKFEVLRVQNLIKTLDALKDKQFCFTVMDEIFNSTTPKEGAAAAYSVAEYLGKYTQSICLIATHFQILTTLGNSFENYNVSVEKHSDGTFTYPFKLAKGSANQNVAIEILQSEGFNSDILDKARELIKAQTPI